MLAYRNINKCKYIIAKLDNNHANKQTNRQIYKLKSRKTNNLNRLCNEHMCMCSSNSKKLKTFYEVYCCVCKSVENSEIDDLKDIYSYSFCQILDGRFSHKNCL